MCSVGRRQEKLVQLQQELPFASVPPGSSPGCTPPGVAMSEITSESRAVATLSAYLDQLLTDELTDELNTSENKRRAFFAFVFGGIVALAIQEDLTPQEAQSVAIGVFNENLRLTPMESARMAQLGIEAAAGDSSWSDASRDGVDEFNAWKANPQAFSATHLRIALDRVPPESAGTE
jgi:hypothetical protein